jgi:hypothetical protein
VPHRLWTLFTGDSTTVQSSDDIFKFFTKRFQVIAKNKYSSVIWPEPSVVKQLTQLAGGLFNWARTVERFIQAGNPKRQLAVILNGDVQGLDSLYQVIIQTRYGEQADVEVHTHFKNITGAIILAKEPLHYNTVAALLGLERDEVDYICSCLQSVLVPGIKLRFSHQSFPDFLSCTYGQCPTEIRFSLQEQSQNLTLAMLKVMKQELKFDICGFPSSYLRNKEVEDLESRISHCISGQLSYSCCFWAEHMHSLKQMVEIEELLNIFFKETFLFWLEVLSLLEALTFAPNALSNLLQVLEASTRKII